MPRSRSNGALSQACIHLERDRPHTYPLKVECLWFQPDMSRFSGGNVSVMHPFLRPTLLYGLDKKLRRRHRHLNPIGTHSNEDKPPFYHLEVVHTHHQHIFDRRGSNKIGD